MATRLDHLFSAVHRAFIALPYDRYDDVIAVYADRGVQLRGAALEGAAYDTTTPGIEAGTAHWTVERCGIEFRGVVCLPPAVGE